MKNRLKVRIYKDKPYVDLDILAKIYIKEQFGETPKTLRNSNWDYQTMYQMSIKTERIYQEVVCKMTTRDNTFVVHGAYIVSNLGGYEVMLSECGEAARLRDSFGSDQEPEITDWLPIEHVLDEDCTQEMKDEGDFYRLVIDPEGYNIPMDTVIAINRMI
jgi:hypothetical protein